MGLLGSILDQTLWVFYDGSLLILIGFAIAGTIHVAVDPARIIRHLGERSLGSAARAALLGAPIPLCSCGVLPTATLLRRKGASREAILSLLISTPETGIDAVAITLAFFGPMMAVIRPFVAVATALVAAALSLHYWPPGTDAHDEPDHLVEPETEAEPTPHHHHHDEQQDLAHSPDGTRGGVNALIGYLKSGLHYGFTELFDELAFSLAFALLLTGVLSAVLPTDFFRWLVPSSFVGMVVMAVLSVPLYVCASASTPIAALFVSKGASAGAALVFLLVGPATNVATLSTVGRLLGGRSLRLYLGTIVGVAICAGLAVDLFVPNLAAGLALAPTMDRGPLSIVKLIAVGILVGFLGTSLRRTGIRAGVTELTTNLRAVGRWLAGIDIRRAIVSWPVLVLCSLWLLSVLVGSFVIVPTGQQAVITRLGKVLEAPVDPGLHLVLPVIDHVELVRVDEVREVPIGYRLAVGALVRQPLIEEALYVTADENVIDLHAALQYRVSDPIRFALRVEQPGEVLSRLTRGRLVEAIAGRPIDAVYTNDRKAVEAWLLDKLRADAKLLGLGVEVLAVRLLDVHAPTNVHDAFRDVASAHEDRLTTIHRANEYAVGTVNVAHGEAERTIAEAESWAMERKAKASGDASAFSALAGEHRRAPQLTEDRLYLESAERTLAGVRKLIRPTAKDVHGYEIWLRQSGAPSAATPPGTEAPDVAAAETASAAGEQSPRAWVEWAPETPSGDAK